MCVLGLYWGDSVLDWIWEGDMERKGFVEIESTSYHT